MALSISLQCPFLRIGTRFGIGLALIALSPLWASATAAPQIHPACLPAPAVRSLLKTYDDQYPDERFEKRKAFLENALKRFPKSIVLHRRYQNLIRYENDDPKAFQAMKEKYRRLYKRYPNDPDILYLYARLFMEDDPETATEYLNRALELDPDHPWAHLALVYRYQYKKPIDKQKAAQHASRVLLTCPNVVEFYNYLHLIQDHETLESIRQKLRALLETHLTPDTAPLYRQLWKLEFRLTPPSQHADVRLEIRRDLEQLAAQHWENDYNWWDLLHHGYQQLGDKPKLQTIEKEMIERFPKRSASIVYDRLLKKANKLLEHPEQLTDDKIREGITELDSYLQKMPTVPILWLLRLKALSYMKSPPKEEILRTAKRFLEVNKKKQYFWVQSGEIAVARVFNDTGIHLERVSELVDKSLQSLEKEHRKQLRVIGDNEDALRMEMRNYYFRKWDAESVRFRALMKLKQWNEVEETLKRLKTLLKNMKSFLSENTEDQQDLAWFNQGYWHMKIELAITREHFADAMAYFQEWLQWHSKMKNGKEHPLMTKLHKMWLENGGSEESWQLWTQRSSQSETIRTADSGPWTRVKKPLPEFEAYDLTGTLWSPKDLKNRIVLINFWATWCGPCKAELPYLQKLHEKLKDRSDVLLLTFNVDEDIGLVKPFLEENQYTFPVLLIGESFQSMVDEPAIPQLWIVDPEGRVRLIQKGFGGDPAEWEKTILEALDRLAQE